MDSVIAFFNHALSFFGDVGDYLSSVVDFFKTGIYDFFTSWFGEFIIWSTIALIKFKIFLVGFAWDVAQQLLTQLNISSVLADAWGQIDSQILNTLTFFRIPEAVNILLSARVTRFVLNFIGL